MWVEYVIRDYSAHSDIVMDTAKMENLLRSEDMSDWLLQLLKEDEVAETTATSIVAR
jgi:hypothetical protein